LRNQKTRRLAQESEGWRNSASREQNAWLAAAKGKSPNSSLSFSKQQDQFWTRLNMLELYS
jgi:hypothetical protein